MALIWVPSSCSTRRSDSLSAWVIKLTASPKCPNRPDRPIRCRYVSLVLGKSKLMTTFTDWMSIPRVNKSANQEKLWGGHVMIRTCETRTKNISYIPWEAGCKLTWSNQMPSGSVTKFVKDTISVRLLHFRVNVITRIPEFRNLFGQQFHTVDRVAKDNALINLKLRK